MRIVVIVNRTTLRLGIIHATSGALIGAFMNTYGYDLLCRPRIVQLARFGGVGVMVLAWFLSLYAPIRISWENGPLENAQVLVLSAAAVVSFLCARKSPETRGLWTAATILWLLLAARELSWGAVFLPPAGMSEHGPTFSSSLLWYRPAVTPVVAIFLGVAVLALVRSGPLRILRMAGSLRALPVFDFCAFVAAMLVSTASEGHMGLGLGGWSGDHQVLEEAVELAAYLFLLSGQMKMTRLACRR